MPVYGGSMYKSMFSLTLLFVLSLGSISFAGMEEDFEALRSTPRSYEDAGAICEEVARLRVADEYPAPQYEVVTGIAYADSQRTIGELDVIVFDKNIDRAIKVAEVKCWKDPRGGLKKAQQQRQRFLSNVRSGKALQFVSTGVDGKRYSKDQFSQIQVFTTIAQKGTTENGFDQELEYTLKEFHAFRSKMIACQQAGECAKGR